MIRDSDDDPADEIEHDDHERRDRVALHELPGSVHRAVEIRLALHDRAFAPRAFGIELARVELRVDRHLLPRHRVERETRRDFGDASRTRRDDDELNRHEDDEHDEPDDEVAADDELAERRDDRSDAAFHVPLREDEPRCGDVEGESKQRRDEQRRRERGELERIAVRDREQQDDARTEDVEREQRVQDRGRERHDQDTDDREHDRGESVRRIFFVHDRTISPVATVSDATIAATAP